MNDKPTFRFTLTVNSQHQDGFKLSVQAADDKQLDIAKQLTDKLIKKITKIEVKVGEEQDY